jgi:hypothetical protein
MPVKIDAKVKGKKNQTIQFDNKLNYFEILAVSSRTSFAATIAVMPSTVSLWG